MLFLILFLVADEVVHLYNVCREKKLTARLTRFHIKVNKLQNKLDVEFQTLSDTAFEK